MPMLKMSFLIIPLIILFSCSNHSIKTDAQTDARTAPKTDSAKGEMDKLEYADYSIVVADTGQDYAVLDAKMYYLAEVLKMPVDTMNRTFDKKKNLIAVSENDEDELYRGEYFLRRFSSENLSIEYLNQYQKNASEKTMAIISGIYEMPQQADSACGILRKFEPGCFTLRAKMYIGCMH